MLPSLTRVDACFEFGWARQYLLTFTAADFSFSNIIIRGLKIKFANSSRYKSATSLLNTTVVAFKVLSLESYAPMSESSPPLKTILELVLWNDLQICRCITPDVIDVIKMPSFQYFLYLQEQKKSLGLDPVNRQGVPTQLFV